MPPTLRSDPARTLLLALGVLAVMLHALTGMGLMRMPRVGNGGISIAICASHGLARDTAPDGKTRPASHDHHDCCKLCAASGPALLTDTSFAVPPAPTFSVSAFLPAPARTASLAVAAHPPRGPPALT